MTTGTKEQELAWLRTIAGELATQTVTRLEDTLPWYGSMPPSRRSAVGLVAQTGISSFIQWYEDPTSTPWIASDVFSSAPRELLRSISLQETLQLIRVVVTVVEDRVTPRSEALREAVLHYSRDVAFAAADVYARQAEARGLWDARLEALVVDSILTGESDDELPSRIAALGWHGEGEAAVLVGSAERSVDVDQLRRTARHAGADVLIGLQGTRLVLVLGRMVPQPHDAEKLPAAEEPLLSFLDIATRLSEGFGDGPLVLGPTVDTLIEASRSARAALAGVAVARSWRHAPRPVLADDLLPERALAGDGLARRTLIEQIYEPLLAHSSELMETLWCYLDNGRSLEGTARELFVHPNTVRYRLKKVSEVIGWNATGARESLILQSALIAGSIAQQGNRRGNRRQS
ncbi:PucR family transcriptional regulator [Leucobacter denitrificans]|uniref:Helix-turn-helix domain-containing protein n=1 Tax=Leucobacter denitrificans TaxID=683042 RepID=A0A7G9S5L1_9MICO|nr:helix-turn-helix domain-containing protein [Leucobacter denitrificans]QNN63136.1 helix-turn-helix domain-containing protein [Leucobacter denitrificans]